MAGRIKSDTACAEHEGSPHAPGLLEAVVGHRRRAFDVLWSPIYSAVANIGDRRCKKE